MRERPARETSTSHCHRSFGTSDGEIEIEAVVDVGFTGADGYVDGIASGETAQGAIEGDAFVAAAVEGMADFGVVHKNLEMDVAFFATDVAGDGAVGQPVAARVVDDKSNDDKAFIEVRDARLGWSLARVAGPASEPEEMRRPRLRIFLGFVGTVNNVVPLQGGVVGGCADWAGGVPEVKPIGFGLFLLVISYEGGDDFGRAMAEADSEKRHGQIGGYAGEYGEQ